MGPRSLIDHGPATRLSNSKNIYFPWSPYLDQDLSAGLGFDKQINSPTVKQEAITVFGRYAALIPDIALRQNNEFPYLSTVFQIKNKFLKPLNAEEAARERGVSPEAAKKVIGEEISRTTFEEGICGFLKKIQQLEEATLKRHEDGTQQGADPKVHENR